MTLPDGVGEVPSEMRVQRAPARPYKRTGAPDIDQFEDSSLLVPTTCSHGVDWVTQRGNAMQVSGRFGYPYNHYPVTVLGTVATIREKRPGMWEIRLFTGYDETAGRRRSARPSRHEPRGAPVRRATRGRAVRASRRSHRRRCARRVAGTKRACGPKRPARLAAARRTSLGFFGTHTMAGLSVADIERWQQHAPRRRRRSVRPRSSFGVAGRTRPGGSLGIAEDERHRGGEVADREERASGCDDG